MEESLLGHLLNANDAEAEAELARALATNPQLQEALEQIRRAVAPLAADRDEIEPPADLWVRTLARVGAHIVATEGPSYEREPSRLEALIQRSAACPVVPLAAVPPPSDPVAPTPSRRSVFAWLGLTAAAVALLVPAVVHLRASADRVACQDAMRQFFQAASSYSDHHDNRFPQVGDGLPVSTIAEILSNEGYLAYGTRLGCPVGMRTDSGLGGRMNFAYSLGFRSADGELFGPERTPDLHGLPLLADAPIRLSSNQALPCNHRTGQNVLYVGGYVRFCTSSTVGINGDDIFVNARGRVAAGVNRYDAVLGRPEEHP